MTLNFERDTGVIYIDDRLHPHNQRVVGHFGPRKPVVIRLWAPKDTIREAREQGFFRNRRDWRSKLEDA